MTGRLRIRRLDLARVPWSFRDNAPTWPHGRYGSRSVYDPFPAYPHELEHVTAAAAHAAARWAPRWDVEVMVANREETGRSNGFSSVHVDSDWVDGERTNIRTRGLIVLSGKRIPIHPAMTRYLVAHEYGHNVEYMLSDAHGHELHSDHLVREYAKVRGLPEHAVHHGAGGSWHDSATEIFACDFRLLVCDVEPEFWPHPGIARPETIPALRDWWAEQAAQHGTAEPAEPAQREAA